MEFRPEPADAGAVFEEVRGVVRSLAARGRIHLSTLVDPALGPLVLDPAKLKQVLYNYVSNAIKFTPDGGRVDLRALAEGAGAVRWDTGPGIRAEDLGRLFAVLPRATPTAAIPPPPVSG